MAKKLVTDTQGEHHRTGTLLAAWPDPLDDPSQRTASCDLACRAAMTLSSGSSSSNTPPSKPSSEGPDKVRELVTDDVREDRCETTGAGLRPRSIFVASFLQLDVRPACFVTLGGTFST